WLGLDWDEAPHVGGDFAPYATAPTDSRYTAVAEQLYDNGDADYNEQGDLCLMPPLSGHISYTDPQLGHLRFDLSQTPTPVLTTAVGTPTAWFRQALDDHRQKITHAVRPASGQQDLPALILFYRLMEWVSPTWVHLPPIRHTAVADTVENLRGAGYLPNALFQHLLQLGWTPPRQQDLWFRSDARRVWRLSDLAPDPVAFDRDALTALNQRYLARLSNADLAAQVQPFLEEYFGPLPRDPRWQETLAHIVRPALRTLGDAPDKAAWAFDEAYEMEADLPGTREAQHALLSRLVAELAHIVLL
ncbi:MAG: hypothetical protein KDD89_16390, partial [Anaerolineales bacterium]|nr:hypothetical protein [Anaerolineales bacterium]